VQTNPAVEQSKMIRWSESPWNQSCRKGKGLWRKGLLKSQVLSSEWNTERVREDASGDSEDGEDDELP